jgi:hypothetical protein
VPQPSVARYELVRRGIAIDEPLHDTGRVFHDADRRRVVNGLNPQRLSYASYASFRDPDGYGWTLQEITARLSGESRAGRRPFYKEALACDRHVGCVEICSVKPGTPSGTHTIVQSIANAFL